MKTKTCAYCREDHPLTDTHWYFRSNGERECRKKRKEQNVKQKVKNRLVINEQQSKRRYTDIEKARARETQAHRTPKGRYRVLKSGAKARGLEVGLSFAEFEELNKRPCHYCGGALPISGSGVDRKDKDIGYMVDNCVPCCTTCNYAKHVMAYENFREWILRVDSYWASSDDVSQKKAGG